MPTMQKPKWLTLEQATSRFISVCASANSAP